MTDTITVIGGWDDVIRQDVSAAHAQHVDDCPLCWFGMEVEFADNEYKHADDWPPELNDGVVYLLDPAQPSGTYANALVDLAGKVPWERHAETSVMRKQADRLRDAANFIAAWRAGGWRWARRQQWKAEGSLQLRPEVARYLARFGEPDPSIPF